MGAALCGSGAFPRERWSNDEMSMAYWGIGAHLGRPWPQNAKGHLLGDVTDHGKEVGDPSSRGNEIGLVGLDFHCDGSDLVGLMCLQTGISGGLSAVLQLRGPAQSSGAREARPRNGAL